MRHKFIKDTRENWKMCTRASSLSFWIYFQRKRGLKNMKMYTNKVKKGFSYIDRNIFLLSHRDALNRWDFFFAYRPRMLKIAWEWKDKISSHFLTSTRYIYFARNKTNFLYRQNQVSTSEVMLIENMEIVFDQNSSWIQIFKLFPNKPNFRESEWDEVESERKLPFNSKIENKVIRWNWVMSMTSNCDSDEVIFWKFGY